MPRAALGRSSKRGFIEKTLNSIAEALKNEVFCEYLAGKPGLLQGLDPRAKLATTLFLIGVAGVFHHIASLVLFNFWLLWLSKSSLVPTGTFVKRVWIAVPLFTGMVVLPTLFNVVRPGTPLLVLLHWGGPVQIGYWTLPPELTITKEGVASAALLILRVGASVSLAILLTLTTRWTTLLKALSVLRIPSVFLTVLEMSYRYIFLLLQTSGDMFMARRSRLVGRASSREERRFVASAMGNLWGKTAALSEEVHGAMLSRGYAGSPKSLVRFEMKRSDRVWIALVIIIAVLFVGGDRVLG
jgi:cobalt/nickel transport system permease protein